MRIVVFGVRRVGKLFETTLHDKNKDWNWSSTQVLFLQVLVLVFLQVLIFKVLIVCIGVFVQVLNM